MMEFYNKIALVFLVLIISLNIGYSNIIYSLNEELAQCRFENNIIVNEFNATTGLSSSEFWRIIKGESVGNVILNKKNITLKENNSISDFYFYYSNEQESSPLFGNYKLNGIFNLNDIDIHGECWSYNGSDESDNWRILNIEQNKIKRRCIYSSNYDKTTKEKQNEI